MAATSLPQSYDETVKDVEATLGILPGFLEALNEDDLVNEWPNFKHHTIDETVIPAKYKELIGLAAAATMKCPYCQHFHREAAKMHGATDEELAEVSFLAGHTARYSSMLHAQNYELERFKTEFDMMGEHLQEMLAADD